jgi:hypothetical protein
MMFMIRPALLFLFVSLLVFGGCTIMPKFTPTTESSKTFQIMYQDSVSKQSEPVVKGQNETLKSLEK